MLAGGEQKMQHPVRVAGSWRQQQQQRQQRPRRQGQRDDGAAAVSAYAVGIDACGRRLEDVDAGGGGKKAGRGWATRRARPRGRHNGSRRRAAGSERAAAKGLRCRKPDAASSMPIQPAPPLPRPNWPAPGTSVGCTLAAQPARPGPATAPLPKCRVPALERRSSLPARHFPHAPPRMIAAVAPVPPPPCAECSRLRAWGRMIGAQCIAVCAAHADCVHIT